MFKTFFDTAFEEFDCSMTYLAVYYIRNCTTFYPVLIDTIESDKRFIFL